MLNIQGVTVAYDNQIVLHDLSITINKGDILCLLGASGSGKTTLLRLIAGIETDYDGVIEFNGSDIRQYPIHERQFGLMFQDHALFPHMNVANNIAFGLRMQGVQRKERDIRVNELLNLVNLPGYEKRDVTSLSGGERQRVALARSLAPEPQLLMLDEPLASLDASLRQQIIHDLHQIIHQLRLTTIYVTHDQAEAYALADRIAVLDQGKIEQIDRPQTLYQSPKTVRVARFLGFQNIFTSDDILGIMTPPYPINSPYILIHPTGITLTKDNEAYVTTILDIQFQGRFSYVTVALDANITLYFSVADYIPMQKGMQVKIHIAQEAIIPLNA